MGCERRSVFREPASALLATRCAPPAIARRTPSEAFGAQVKGRPKGAGRKTFLHYRIRNDRVDHHGKIALRYAGVLRHLAVGHAHDGERVVALVADGDVRVLSDIGALRGHYVIDPAKRYQAKRPG